MDTTANLFMVGIIIILGLLAQYNFKKTKIPDVLILIASGAIFSHLGLVEGIKTESSQMTFLIVFSLIYVVFYGALPIKLRALLSTMNYAFISSVLNFILITFILGATAHYFLGFGWIAALSLGALFCVLDGSVINSILETIKLSPKAEAEIQTESAIIDILVIVGILSVMNFSTMTVAQITQSLTSYLFLSLGIGIVIAMIWAFVLKHMGNYSSAPIATMALLVTLYAFAEYVNANGVITIFVFSIMLGNVTIWSRLLYKEQKESVSLMGLETKHFFKDISFLIRTFLFVYLGILVDFSQWTYLLYGTVFFIIAYITRTFVRRTVKDGEMTKKDTYILDAMCAKGLTPTVMLSVVGANIAFTETANLVIFTNIVVGGIFSSILVSSILVLLIDRDKFTSLNELITWVIEKYRQHRKKNKNETSKTYKPEEPNNRI